MEVDELTELQPLLLEIGRKLSFRGPLNIQLMKGKNGPVPFELNCRFSGTTAIRANFGFNEPEMAIRHFYLNETLPPNKIRKGMAFRYSEEVFLNGVTADDLKKRPLPAGEVRPWF